MRVFYCIIIIVFFVCFYCEENAYAVENDLGLWAPIYLELPINKKVESRLEINTRLQDNVTALNQLVVRPSIGYNINDKLSLWAGHAWSTYYSDRFLREQRPWQQILLMNRFGKLLLVNRTRLEERFIQDVEGVSIRGRHSVKGIYSLGNKQMWELVLANELFVNLNSHFGGPQAGIDQNRFYTGIARVINKNVKVETGYQLQYINQPSPKMDRLNHAILISLFITLPQLLKD